MENRSKGEKMKKMIHSTIRTYRQEGTKATMRKIKAHLFGQNQVVVNSPSKINMDELPQMPQFSDLAKADYIHHPYVKPEKLSKDKLNIAWVSPPVGPGGGGHTTISRFVKYLQSQGHPYYFLYISQ